MATFQYRLQPLLDSKIEARKEAERAVAACRVALQEAEKQLGSLEQQEQSLQSERQRLRNEMVTSGVISGYEIQRCVGDISIASRLIEDTRDEMLAQRLSIEECEERVNQALAAAAELSRQEQVLIKHREKQERKFCMDEERRDANEQDEIASTLYEARRRK